MHPGSTASRTVRSGALHQTMTDRLYFSDNRFPYGQNARNPLPAVTFAADRDARARFDTGHGRPTDAHVSQSVSAEDLGPDLALTFSSHP